MQESLQIGDRLLFIFDGRCGLCNRSVRWFLARDRLDRLRFVPSESANVAGVLARHGLDAAAAIGNSGSILVAQCLNTPSEQLLSRSDAVLTLLSQLPSPWPTVARTLRLIPRPLRDLAYRLVSRWRYSVWGRLEACPIPTAEERSRFV